jgi:2'-hydroxyisoflavone reductase
MRILVIGGTEFVGRHFVARALSEGHGLTLFNRGVTNPELFPEAERIRGDRDGGLAPLAGRTWDVAVDTCGYVPRSWRARLGCWRMPWST